MAKVMGYQNTDSVCGIRESPFPLHGLHENHQTLNRLKQVDVSSPPKSTISIRGEHAKGDMRGADLTGGGRKREISLLTTYWSKSTRSSR